MIVKIIFDSDIVMYDNFERVMYKRINKDKIKGQADSYWLSKKEDSESQPKLPIQICCRKRSKRDDKDNLGGLLFAVITDCPTYLLNDDGKTIERIN